MGCNYRLVEKYNSFAELFLFRFGKRAAHKEANHNLHNVRVNILAQFVQYAYFVLYVKTIFNFVPTEAYFDRYVLSKVVIVCYFV